MSQPCQSLREGPIVFDKNRNLRSNSTLDPLEWNHLWEANFRVELTQNHLPFGKRSHSNGWNIPYLLIENFPSTQSGSSHSSNRYVRLITGVYTPKKTIIIFHQPRFPWNKGIGVPFPLLNSPPFGGSHRSCFRSLLRDPSLHEFFVGVDDRWSTNRPP